MQIYPPYLFHELRNCVMYSKSKQFKVQLAGYAIMQRPGAVRKDSTEVKE